LEAASVDKAKVLALARRTAENVTDFDQALAELEYRVGVAIEVSREGRGGDNLGAFVDAVLARVRRRYDANDFDAAAAEATTGFVEWRRRETERRAEAAQAGLKILNAGLRQDILRRDPAAAAERIELVAGIKAGDGAMGLIAALRTHFDEWYHRGRDKGLNFDLEVAIEIARRALVQTRTADERGAWHNLLGNTLAMLGERESGTERLEEALRALRAALEEYNQDRVPLEWAMTQNNLSNALRMLGERENGMARLAEAVRACRAALEERTRNRVPLLWAMTQGNLGNALLKLGARGDGTTRLVEAVRAYRAALEEQTRDRVPLDWALTQNNLGAALATLGEREGGTARLKKAVRAFRAALEV
jgi:tetratricopeptide (TPR) repeat protein